MRALALSQENTEVCYAYSVVEQSVHWETGGSARRLFTIQGHTQPSRPGILWGGARGETLAEQIKGQASYLKMPSSMNLQPQEFSNHPSLQEVSKPSFGIEHTVAFV